MKRVLMICCFCSFINVCRADNSLVKLVVDRQPEERIKMMLNLVDTSSVIRSSPGKLDDFLTGLETASAKLPDHRLKRYLTYLRKTGYTIYEKDSKARRAVYKHAEEHFRKSGDKLMQAICLYYIGQENVILGNYGESFESSIQAKNMMEEIGYENIPEIGRYLHGIALNYYFFRDYSTVVEIMREALAFPPYNANLDIQRYNTLALCYRNIGKPDSAAYYFRATINLAKNYQDSTWIALASGNLGGLFAKQSLLDEALPLLQMDYRHNRKKRDTYDMARNASLEIANIWLRKNKPDSALHYLISAQQLSQHEEDSPLYGEQQRDEEFLRSYYGMLSRYYENSGDFRSAYRYLDSLHQISQQLDHKYSTMVAKRAEDRLSIQQYLSEIKLEKQRREIATTRWLWGFTALFLLTLSIGLLYYLTRLKEAKERAIRQLRENEIEAERKLSQASIERAIDKLRHQLKMLEEKNRLINRLKDELKELQSKNGASSPLVEETIQKLINSRLLTQEDWSAFRRQFNAIFNNSLDELKSLYPDLTQSEERIYALSQLEVGTSQMASMLGISPDSVRKARYRLNRRLKKA